MSDIVTNAAVAEPKILVRPTTQPSSVSVIGNVIVSAVNDDQPILMEARLVEMISSLRQLIHSNQLLDEALLMNDGGGHDKDLFQALEENEVLIVRKCANAQALAARLQTRGVSISLDDKIPKYDGSVVLRRMREQVRVPNVEDDGGMHL